LRGGSPVGILLLPKLAIKNSHELSTALFPVPDELTQQLIYELGRSNCDLQGEK
jgi:hypothetical protein